MHIHPVADRAQENGYVMDPRPDMLHGSFGSDHTGAAAKAHRYPLRVYGQSGFHPGISLLPCPFVFVFRGWNSFRQ
ncbi:hypothetical protein D3C73_1598950 [compost metagenome]